MVVAMGKIGYGYGSEWHLLRYLGYHRGLLEDEILKKTGGERITWHDFKFSNVNESLKRDVELKGVEFLDKAPQKLWKSWWPQTGNAQNWDAVGQLHVNGSMEWLLVEAKAHIDEMHSTCGAISPVSKKRIKSSFVETMKSFCSEEVPVENWLSTYYQFCNRLAVIHFLNQVCTPRVPARLVMIYFYGDKAMSKECPKSPIDWENELNSMYTQVGFNPASKLSSNIHTVFLSVNPDTV
jgi:hypothetical protein